jgi:uncharacterized membrane protein
VSLESGKKYGFTASIINVLTPVFAVALVFGLIFYQLTVRPTGAPSPFLAGALTGLMIVLSAVALAGLILFVLAMHKLSQYYNEPSIFKNVLYGLLITIAAGVVSVVLEFGLIATIAYPSTVTSTAAVALITRLMLGFLAVFTVAIISAVINAVLYWRAFTKLGERSGVEVFKTAGLLYLIGSVLMIVAVGVIIVWVAWIYAAKGFRASTIPPTITPQNLGKIYCSYCGNENDQNAIYCKHCGKPLHTSQASV